MTIIQPRVPSCRDVIDLWPSFQSDLVLGTAAATLGGPEPSPVVGSDFGRTAAHTGPGSVVRLTESKIRKRSQTTKQTLQSFAAW